MHLSFLFLRGEGLYEQRQAKQQQTAGPAERSLLYSEMRACKAICKMCKPDDNSLHETLKGKKGKKSPIISGIRYGP